LFLGHYTAEIKPHNRLSLPGIYHELIPDGVYAAQGFDRNVMMFPNSTFDRLVQHITSLNIADPLARLFLRMFLGTARFLEAGRDGALTLPEELADFAGLAGKIILVGQGDYFELWSPGQWEGQMTQLNDFQANAQRFSAFTISTR
jgi:division/cell wall cluster transcriptional repressor MraZ